MGADFGDECFAEGEDDVPILMSILENGVALIARQIPARGGDYLVVPIKGFVGRDEVETRIARIFTN